METTKKKLELNVETVRRLRKRDLEEVMGGTICITSCTPSCNKPKPRPVAATDDGTHDYQ
jgi:hypothetical protein